MALLLLNLKNKQENYNISTSCNATRLLWVSNEAENFNKARNFSLVRYFSTKYEKTSKNQQEMNIFSLFLKFLKVHWILAGK